jgi:hypothetical protein
VPESATAAAEPLPWSSKCSEKTFFDFQINRLHNHNSLHNTGNVTAPVRMN